MQNTEITTQEAIKCIKQAKLITFLGNKFLEFLFCTNVTNFQKENNSQLYWKCSFRVKQEEKQLPCSKYAAATYASPLIPIHHSQPLYTLGYT